MASITKAQVTTRFRFRQETLSSTAWPAPPVGMQPRRAAAVALALIVVWALWAGAFNTAQFGDNIEQFNWAQSLELGYHKHPPLPSWVLGAVIELFGPSIYWAYALATLCLLGTAALTWSIGRELLGERIAAAGLVLWGLNMTFSQRVQLYNHNTVLVLFIAATVWCAMRASRSADERSVRWWLAAGLAAAAAMLSKYQALVPLGGLVAALLGSGRLAHRRHRAGLALAIVAMVAVCMPHAWWVYRHNFTTLRYASEAVEAGGPLRRAGYVVAFFANQIRLWCPALAALLLAWGWERFRGRRGARAGPAKSGPIEPAADRAVAPSRASAAWMFGLVGLGLAALVVMALASGVSLRNHWGVQTLQFFGLWLAGWWDRRQAIRLEPLVAAALAVHAVSLSVYAIDHLDPASVLVKRRIDTMYPARRLAQTAVSHWSQASGCPLRYVAGTVFDAGLVSLYSGGRLQVFDSEAATPWISPEDIRRHGALYVLEDQDAVPVGATDVVSFELVPGNRIGMPHKTLRLAVRLPAEDCAARRRSPAVAPSP